MHDHGLQVSVVICTYNRDEFLERTLRSLNHLNYDRFEVIVVNGPSTDRTAEILDSYKDRIKIRSNPIVNLSVSRNIGIKAAAGQVVAFLDDDAIPRPEWLNQLVEIYCSEKKVGGVGGRVYGPGGDHFQFYNGYINIWGEAVVKQESAGIYTVPKAYYYNIMMGVNSSFSRDALAEVGGFDEYYEYFHDESDVCVRLTNAGFPILHHQEAYVHHEFARSHIRKSNYHMNWYPIIKNSVYFGVKNSAGVANNLKRFIRPIYTAGKRIQEFKVWLRQGNITKKDYRSFMKMWRRGVLRGTIDGFLKPRRLRWDLKEPDEAFLEFKRDLSVPIDPVLTNQSLQIVLPNNPSPSTITGICLLSKSYPPYGSGGVGTYTKTLAEGLVSKGYRVFVLTSTLPEDEKIVNGVHLIRINYVEDQMMSLIGSKYPVTARNVSYSILASHKVQELADQGLINIVETPVWDYEGLATIINVENVVTAVRLETPLRKAAEMQNWSWNRDLELSANLEKLMIDRADGVISISNGVAETISSLYKVSWEHKNMYVVPLGLDVVSEDKILTENKNDPLQILFVGRLERRKGIDVLLKAFEKVWNENRHVELYIAGNDKIPYEKGKTIREIFTEKHANSELLNHVYFLGEVSDEQLQELYSKCDIFVAPSRYESFGLVYLEAMNYAKPVIGTNIGGIPEIIQDQVNGLLIPPDDVSELVQAIITLVKNEDLRISMGRKGREILTHSFTNHIMIERTIDVYNKLLHYQRSIH